MKLLIFDGNSVVNRAFYGIRLLTTKDGAFTNAIYGFLNIYLKFISEEKPDLCAVAFDLKAPTFRHKMYSGYKATRKGMPEELALQIQPLKDILSAMGVPMLEQEGYEADDIIGTVSARCTDENIDCVIVTGDRDDLQLINERVTVKLAVPSQGKTETELYDTARVMEKYGVSPMQLIDVKALMGDTSDNIPGVKGIGEKTALSLISKFKTLDALYDNIENADITASVKNKLTVDKEMAFLSRTLAEICKNVPMDDVKTLTFRERDEEKLYSLLASLELNRIIERLGADKSDAESCIDIPNSISASDGFDLSSDLVFVCATANGFCVYDGKKAFNMGDTMFDLSLISDFFADDKCKKVTNDAKLIAKTLLEMSLPLPKGIVFDTSLAAYLINPATSDFSAKALLRTYCSKSCDEDSLSTVAALSHLYPVLKQQISDGSLDKLLYEVEIPLACVLAEMEHIGFTVDEKQLSEFGKQLASEIALCEEKIYTLCGKQFNINSTKQLAEILFGDLGLKPVKKTKTGFSTDNEVLEKLRGDHEVIEYLLEYRRITKLKSTYADGLSKVIDTHDKRIHTTFNQTVTLTGRLSSTEPNLQNIPVRHPLGREIRKMFVASEGHLLCDGDYSQIELRVLAEMAGDEAMINAFADGTDIHTLTASQVFGVEPDMVTDRMRSNAKAVNFGIVYGISDYSLSEDIKVSVYEAREYIKSYFERYPNVKLFMDSSVEKAEESGMAQTLFGRRRFIPELRAKNFNERSFGKRVAMNMPIQGTAADIIKIAMVNVFNRLRNENMQSKLIMQVHDELIIEAPEDEAERAAEILREEMEKAVSMNVKLSADVHIGKSWFDAK